MQISSQTDRLFSRYSPKRVKNTKSRLRRAMTLIETSIVLIIITAAMAAGANIYSAHLENRTNQVAAQELTKVSSAFGRYLKDNYGLTQQKAVLAGGVVEIPVTELSDGGYLYETFQNRNPFGQQYRLTARYIAASGPGENDRLESVIYTSGGEIIAPSSANDIAQLVGAGGGFTMPDGDTSEVRSTFGGFTLDLQTTYGRDPGPGKLVSAMFFDDEGSLVSDFLYRNAIPGRPDLNTMNTAINMDGNDINNIGHVASTTLAVTDSATIGKDLLVNENVQIAGELSVQNHSLFQSTVNVQGVLTTQSDVTVGQDLTVTRDAQIFRDLSVQGNTDVTGDVTVLGGVGVTGYVTPGVAVEGASCAGAPVGAIARTAAGSIISCQTGIWTSSEAVGQYSFFMSPTCPSGWVVANGANGTADLRGMFIRGLDLGRGVDPGRSLGSHQASQNKWHIHTGTTDAAGEHSHNGAGRQGSGDPGGFAENGGGFVNPNGMTDMAGTHTHNITLNGEGGVDARPENVALLPCMKR